MPVVTDVFTAITIYITIIRIIMMMINNNNRRKEPWCRLAKVRPHWVSGCLIVFNVNKTLYYCTTCLSKQRSSKNFRGVLYCRVWFWGLSLSTKTPVYREFPSCNIFHLNPYLVELKSENIVENYFSCQWLCKIGFLVHLIPKGYVC